MSSTHSPYPAPGQANSDDSVGLPEGQFLRILIDSIPHKVWAASADGRLHFANRRLIEYAGCSEREIAGWGWHAMVHPDDLAGVGRSFDRKVSFGMAVRVVDRRGGYRRHWLGAEFDAGAHGFGQWHCTFTDSFLPEADVTAPEVHESFLRNASDGIHILDRYGTVIEASDSFCRMLGYSREEVIGMNVMHWDAHFRDRQELIRAIADQLAIPARSQFQTRHRRKDGSVFDVEVSGYPVQLGGDLVLFNSSRDITERLRVAAALEESHAKLDGLFRLSRMGIVLTDLLGRCIEFNDAFRAICRCSPDGLGGFDCSTLMPGDVAAEPARRLEALGAKGYCGPYEKELVRKDGSLVVLRINGVQIRRSGGDGLVWWMVEDVSESKRLQREMELMQFITDHLAEGVSLSDEQGRLLYVNKAFAESLGYARDAVLSMRIGDLDPGYCEDNWPRHWEELKRIGSLTFETNHRTRGGEILPVEVAANYIRYGGQEYNCAYVRYIAERKNLEREIRIAATAFESQVGILVTDENANILRVNGAFTRITGYSAAEVVGRNPRILHSGRQGPDFYKVLWQGVQDSGYWSGELWNRRKSGELFAEQLTITAVKDGDGRVTNYVGSLSDVTLTKKTEEEIQRLVLYDPLTGLPNRRMLMDRLQVALAAAARTGLAGALLFIDLDNFKIVNDTRGHAVGDWLLQQVGNRLASEVREDDTVARFGGDEFVVMLQNLAATPADASERAAAVAEKIIASLAVPLVSAESRFLCTPSIGVTLFQDGRTPSEELLKQADIAMYEAKKAGGNTWKFYDQKVQEAITARVTLEAELRRAIEATEFVLHYQVQVDLRGQPVGAEALIRWRHSVQGIVSPARFIPLLEETGLIIPTGLWILDTACRQLKCWEEWDETRGLVLAVNVSAKQFHQPDFVDQVFMAVKRHGIDPGRLELEITESVLLDDTEAVIAAMQALGKFGVRLALDDFGTGYSSLNYLRRLPLNVLKIDQSFVQELGPDTSQGAIVQTIIAMAKILDLVVVAEGVETALQKKCLDEWGCGHYQGYLFGRPMPVEQFEANLRRKSLTAT